MWLKHGFNFLKILLIFSMVHFTYGKNGLWLLSSAVGVSEGFAVSLSALHMASLLYPFLLRASVRCFFSSRKFLSSDTLFAQWKNVLRTACFCAGGWCEVAWRYLPVWVAFLYTRWSRDRSLFRDISTTKKGISPFASTSMAKWIELCIESVSYTHLDVYKRQVY